MMLCHTIILIRLTKVVNTKSSQFSLFSKIVFCILKFRIKKCFLKKIEFFYFCESVAGPAIMSHHSSVESS